MPASSSSRRLAWLGGPALVALALALAAAVAQRQSRKLESQDSLTLKVQIVGPSGPVPGARIQLYRFSQRDRFEFELTFPCEPLRRGWLINDRWGDPVRISPPSADELVELDVEARQSPAERARQPSWALAAGAIGRFSCPEGGAWLLNRHEHPALAFSEQSDPGGMASFPGLDPGSEWELVVTGFGLQPATRLLDASPDELRSRAAIRQIQLRRATLQRVQVVDTRGRPIPAAHFLEFVGSPPLPLPEAPLSAPGSFMSSEGTLRAAVAEGYLPAVASGWDPFRSSSDRGCDTGGELHLSRPGTLGGRVQRQGVPVAGATVSLTTPCSQGTRERRTGADGHFEFGDVAAGSYTVLASLDGAQSELTLTLADGASQLTLALDLDRDPLPPEKRLPSVPPPLPPRPRLEGLTSEEWFAFWASDLEEELRQMQMASNNMLNNPYSVDFRPAFPDSSAFAANLAALAPKPRTCEICKLLELAPSTPTTSLREIAQSDLALRNVATPDGELGVTLAGIIPPRGGPVIGQVREAACAACKGTAP